MFKRLLVPLDGSALAESILPIAAFLAGCYEAVVVLMHVIEPEAPAEVHGQPHLHTEPEAEAYLQHVATSAFSPQIRVETHVHADKIITLTRSISAHVAELGSDLILMCTHGRGGARQFLFGSLAQQIENLGATPVLFFRAMTAPPAAPVTIRNLLVPLDGEPSHEHSLPVAASLAKKCGAAIHLVRIVPTYGDLSGPWVQPSRLLPGTTSRMLEMAVQEAQEYLNALKVALEKEDITVTAAVYRGDPPEVIALAAAECQADLIVAGTHGRVGTDAFWSGSVTPKLCRLCAAPVLLVPAQGEPE